MAKSTSAELVFVPLGGVGEIGMNFALYGFGPADEREWIDRRLRRDLPGRDAAGRRSGPARHPLHRGSSCDNLRGIVITHAHEDHYGALLDLWPKLKAPV